MERNGTKRYERQTSVIGDHPTQEQDEQGSVVRLSFGTALPPSHENPRPSERPFHAGRCQGMTTGATERRSRPSGPVLLQLLPTRRTRAVDGPSVVIVLE